MVHPNYMELYKYQSEFSHVNAPHQTVTTPHKWCSIS